MRVIVLGYYGGYPTRDIGTSSYLLESEGYHLLLDAGSGSLLALEHHLDPLDLDSVLITHYHHDHVADLGVLQFTRLLKRDGDGNRSSILPIYGHNDDEQAFSKITMDEVSQGIDYTKQDQISIGPFDIFHLKMLHPVPCYAFRILERKTGKVMVFTADSGFIEELIPLAKDADLLIADSNFFKGMENHSVHMTSKECGQIANKANVKTLVLSHLPQEGDLQKLRREAAEEAPKTKTILAEKNLELII
ncbi:MBL fold metallo-hydrolase [Marinilactibacillus psychrotolerans]|uniref:MBL fold metallo-hydrolase n=1 Tax=Marinilactibacillus psychrotolerans TaxID=191770 RepID=UPI0038852153